MAEDKAIAEGEKNEPRVIDKKKRKGVMSRIWSGIFRFHGDDIEKRLQNISKEEAAVLSRMKRRSLTWRKMTRHLIVFSVIFEVFFFVIFFFIKIIFFSSFLYNELLDFWCDTFKCSSTMMRAPQCIV